MCVQTGLGPNRRTIVANFAWIVELYNGKEVRNFWVDVSTCGLEQLDALRAQLQADQDAIELGHTFPVSQYHIYFEDGGHARPRILYDMKQAELSYNNYYPDRKPTTGLSPLPEYYVQEGLDKYGNPVVVSE